MGYSALGPSEQEKDQKRKDFFNDLEPFRIMMYRLLSTMGHPGIIMDMTTGEWNDAPNPPHIQSKIDEILKMRDNHVKKYWPEFYKPE